MTLGPFGGVNAGYVVELYERFRQNPESVDPATREVFEQWAPVDATSEGGTDVRVDVHKIVGAANLAESIRRYGHLAARLDPLGSDPIGRFHHTPTALQTTT
jgi:2-oxoglutarate dehydrogenase E1 component